MFGLKDEIEASADTTETPESLLFCPPVTGDYLLAIYGYHLTDQGPYEVSLRRTGGSCCADDPAEDNDVPDQAKNLVCGGPVAARLCPRDDDWWVLKLERSHWLELSLSCSGDNGDLELEVSNAEGSVIAGSVSDGCSESVSLSLPAGVYLVRITGNDGAQGDYELRCDQGRHEG